MQFLNYSGLEHYHSLLLGLFVKQEALANYYTKAEADILHTSMVRIKGDVTYEEQNLERVFTMEPTEVGDSYICREAGIYLDGHHISHVLEVGDIVVSLGDPTGNDGIHEYTVIQSNWTATTGTPTLEWGKSTVLASVGGINITATLPNDPAVNKADLSALDAYLPLTGGTMSGDITMSGESKLIFGNTSVFNNGYLFIDGGMQVNGRLYASGFEHAINNSNNYVLLAGGGTKLLSEITEGYATEADLTAYLPLTGGTLTGNLSLPNNGYLFFGNLGTIQTDDNTMTLVAPSAIDLFATTTSAFEILADSFVKKDSSDSYILLGGGGTKLLSEITGAYLPLTGGTMSGDIDFASGSILFSGGQDGSISIPNQGILQLEAGGSFLQLGLDRVLSSVLINAPAFYETSDIRKKNIKSDLSLDKCYDLIDKCQTVIYSLKDQTKEQVGMIAQEIEEFFPEVVATDEEGFKSLAYDRLVVICFKVLKDVIKRLEKLENGL